MGEAVLQAFLRLAPPQCNAHARSQSFQEFDLLHRELAGPAVIQLQQSHDLRIRANGNQGDGLVAFLDTQVARIEPGIPAGGQRCSSSWIVGPDATAGRVRDALRGPALEDQSARAFQSRFAVGAEQRQAIRVDRTQLVLGRDERLGKPGLGQIVEIPSLRGPDPDRLNPGFPLEHPDHARRRLAQVRDRIQDLQDFEHHGPLPFRLAPRRDVLDLGHEISRFPVRLTQQRDAQQRPDRAS